MSLWIVFILSDRTTHWSQVQTRPSHIPVPGSLILIDGPRKWHVSTVSSHAKKLQAQENRKKHNTIVRQSRSVAQMAHGGPLSVVRPYTLFQWPGSHLCFVCDIGFFFHRHSRSGAITHDRIFSFYASHGYVLGRNKHQKQHKINTKGQG